MAGQLSQIGWTLQLCISDFRLATTSSHRHHPSECDTEILLADVFFGFNSPPYECLCGAQSGQVATGIECNSRNAWNKTNHSRNLKSRTCIFVLLQASVWRGRATIAMQSQVGNDRARRLVRATETQCNFPDESPHYIISCN